MGRARPSGPADPRAPPGAAGTRCPSRGAGPVDAELEGVAAEPDLDVEREERDDHLAGHVHEALGRRHRQERGIDEERRMSVTRAFFDGLAAAP